MIISDKDKVTLHYRVKLEHGEIIESSRGREPVSFTIGSKQLLQGLEKELIGLKKRDKKEIKVPPDKRFGERRDELLQEAPKTIFKEKPSPQTLITLRSKDGSESLATVHDVKENAVFLDFNHPLAGHNATYDIKVIDITPT